MDPDLSDTIYIDNLRASESNSSKPRLDSGNSVLVRADLIDPLGNIRARQDKLIEWNNSTIQHFVDPRDGQNRSLHGEVAYSFALTPGISEPGIWTVRVYNAESLQPFHYEVPMLFLPSRAIIDSTNENLLMVRP